MTSEPEARLELHARSGRAVLVDDGAEIALAQLPISDELVYALDEWARVAGAVAGGDHSISLVSRRGRQLAAKLADAMGEAVGYVDPLSGRVAKVGRARSAPLAATRVSAKQHGGPTPWATGLTISAIVGVIVAIALTVVSLGLSEVNVFVAVAVNLGVAAGFAPSIWLGRNVLVWRWVAFGGAAGIVGAWVMLGLSALG